MRAAPGGLIKRAPKAPTLWRLPLTGKLARVSETDEVVLGFPSRGSWQPKGLTDEVVFVLDEVVFGLDLPPAIC